MGVSAGLRVTRLGTLPSVNIGSTDDLVEIVTFALGLDPAQIDVSIDEGSSMISDECKCSDFEMTDDMCVYADEHSTGVFRRVIELPQNVDPSKVNARYASGCSTISVGKLEASRPR